MPLHYAAESGHLGVAAVLIEAGAPLTAKTSRGRTPLDTARASSSTHRTELVALIQNPSQAPAVAAASRLAEPEPPPMSANTSISTPDVSASSSSHGVSQIATPDVCSPGSHTAAADHPSWQERALLAEARVTALETQLEAAQRCIVQLTTTDEAEVGSLLDY